MDDATLPLLVAYWSRHRLVAEGSRLEAALLLREQLQHLRRGNLSMQLYYYMYEAEGALSQ